MLLFSAVASANITNQQEYIGNNYFGSPGSEIQLGSLLNKTTAGVDFVYDTAVDGGSVGAHTLSVKLPAGAIITRSFIEIKTQFASASGNSKVALSCEDANNIKTSTDIDASAAGAFIEGESTGAASAFKKVDAECSITATIASEAATAGKLQGFLSYFISD